MSFMEVELDDALEVALHISHAAASIIDRVIEENSTTLLDADSKGNPADIVAQCERQCREEMIAFLRARTPHYNVLSREAQETGVLTDTPTWLFDPIDSTGSLIHGLFDCCVSVALVVNREPVIGVVSAPRLREVFSAVRGRGAFCNGQRIHVSECRNIGEALVFMHHSHGHNEAALESILAIQKTLASIPVHALRSSGSVALDMCFVACGKGELYFDEDIQCSSVAAGAIIVREAGGVVHNIDNTDSFDLMSSGFCCANSLQLSNLGVDLVAKYGRATHVMQSE